MYASAFDLRPQPGEMVVSRSDVKRRRKEGNAPEESIQGSPKRTKVHAQRKFAQGSSNMSSPALTPVKDKDKVKTNGVVLSPELIPTKRPKTEDFLTFLCFRGTPILPPSLDFFNVATVQEILDEEQGSSLGECSRESTRNSRIASTSLGSSKLQRSTDRSVTETTTSSGAIKKFDRSESDGRRKPPTAVQALRRKYQEQRLAKQRASTLKKLAQKVKGKNMVRTRSSTHNEEVSPSTNAKPSRGNIVKKSVRSVNIVQRKIRSPEKPGLLTRMHTQRRAIMKNRNNRTTVNSIRRDGLRSGGQLPPGSEAGLKSERVLKQPEQPQQTRFKSIMKKKIEKSTVKTFASSVSDFSSDDDQPLAKKMKVKSIENTSSSRQLARKVIKRIVSKRMKPRMVTRSQQQQQQPPEKEQTETRLYTRPPRKTKEAAAIYMELLGRKLITPEADVDEDSLSIDSFPELPNARRIERRESEIKARAYKERKEAQQSKEDAKGTVPQKSKLTAGITLDKRRKIEVVKAKRLSVRNSRLSVQKPEFSKNVEKIKPSQVPKNLNKKASVTVKENMVNKKRDVTGVGLQMRPRKVSTRQQSVDNQFIEEREAEVESDGGKLRPSYVPRRSLRRGSREAAQEVIVQGSCDTLQQSVDDIILPASNSGIPPAGTSSKNLSRKSKPMPSLSTSSSLTRIERNLSKSQENNLVLSEETFSDSDEEPLGKLALKHSTIKRHSKDVILGKDIVAGQDSEAGKEEARVVNRKVSKTEGKALLLTSDNIKKENMVTVKAGQVLKKPVVPVHKGNEKKVQQPYTDTSKVKAMELMEVVGTSSKELSQRRNDDNANTLNTELLLSKNEVDHVTKGRELPHRRSDVINCKNKEKLLKIIDDGGDDDDNTKTEDILQGKNDIIAKNTDISNRKSEESEITRSSGMPPIGNDDVGPKNREESCGRSEEETVNEEVSQRMTSECVNARYKETLLRRSDEFVRKMKDVSLTEVEGELYGKKKESSPRQGEVDLPSKEKEMVLESSEDHNAKWEQVSVKQSGNDINNKTNEVSLKKCEEVCVKSTEIRLRNKDDLSNKKRTASGRKFGDSNIKNKELKTVNPEDVVITKNESMQLEEIGETISSVKNKVTTNTKSKELLIMRNEKIISKNIEASQRNTEDRLNKNKLVLQRRCEDGTGVTEREVLSKKSEDLGSLNEEVLFGSGENCLKTVEVRRRKKEDTSTRMVEIPSVENEDYFPEVEVSKSVTEDRYLTQNTWLKSEYILAAENNLGHSAICAPSVADVEPLTKDHIITKAKELVDVIISREEKLEPHKVISVSNKAKNMSSRFRNEIVCSSKVDTPKSSHVTKRKFLQFKTESQTFKTGKQTRSIVSSISESNKTVQVANNVTVLNTERDLSNVQISASDNISSEKSESILQSAETQSNLMSPAGIKTSPKNILDDSTDSEQDVILRKLSEEQVCLLLSNSLSAQKEEPISKFPPTSILPISDTVLKQGSKTKASFEDSPAKHLYRNENETGKVETETPMVSHLPVVIRVGVTSMKGTAISKSDDKTRGRCTNFRVVDVRRSENGPSSQSLEFHAKSSVAVNRVPTFRDKVKAKVNMSNEQIEKWLNESYIDETDSKNLMFDKCIESISEEGETSNTIDYMVSTGTKEHDYRASSLEEVVKSGKGIQYLRETDDEHLYKPNKSSSFGRDGFQEKVTELPDVTPQFGVSFKQNVSPNVALVSAESSAESLLSVDEGKCSRTNQKSTSSLVKEPESVGVGVIPISQQRIEVESIRNEKETQRDISKEETGIGKLQRDICSTLALEHLERELNMPGTSCNRTDRHQRCNEDSWAHNVQSDTIEEKINKLNSEAEKQETNISHHSIKSHLVQDRGGEKKSIFQQRRSFLHKAKERKDLTPSANAFSPENESSVYAFDSEPELPPVSTPFRRRARDSRTSSTTTSKSEEDLARLDDEITPPPSAVQVTVQNVQSPAMQTLPSSQVQTVQSSVVQTVQSERLTLPVVGQPIQTLPLSTAIVQIIPTLPITMRPVQVENYVPAQQQQQQQLLLLQNDAVMTTLKTGCTSSTSIAVQVNLDNEPSLDISSENTLTSDLAAPEPQLQRSMECSTQTDVAEEEEDDSEGHLFYIPLQQPGTGGPLAAPAQQLIQGVAVKLGTEGPTGPNQRVIMRAKLVTKPPTFNRTAVGIQDGSTVGIGRSVLTTQHQRPAGMLMAEQKNLYGSAVGASSTVSSGTYPPVGTVQPTARGRPVVPPSNHTKSDDTLDTKPDHTDALKPSVTSCKTGDISSHLHAQSEVDSKVDKPLAVVSAKLINKDEQNIVPSSREQKCSVSQNALPSSPPSDVVASKLPTSKGSGNVGKERRSSTEVNSPSTSSASKSTAGSSKRSSQKVKSASYACKPSNSTSFPSLNSPAQMVEAPVFHPTEKEFQDPLEYIDRIRPVAEKFGLCRVVPPSNFKPECKVTDDMRFLAYNQYVHKMLHRWGPNVKEMMAIKKYLATQNISFNHPPWIGGMEVDLPRLYKIVQSFGGLKEVIEKKKWHRVADGMKIPKSAQDRVTKLDDIYCKYLLPYDTLSPDERQKLLDEVEQEWIEREKRVTLLSSPGGSDLPEEESEGDTSDESEECIVKGRNMPLNAFYRIARNTMSMWFRQAEPPASEVEQEFWRHVTLRQSHVCVHSGSIDSSGWGYGFPCSKNSPFARHPWNLKVLTNNSGSILRSIGPIMGVTVPTLHVGMLFTTCCWYRDPHGLPWVEYLHTGANKIWYGIPDEYSSVFRSALTKLVPRYCKNKTIWLPSDTAMVPPPMLVKHGVSLCHTVQEPGQFILVFPRAFTSSICTGYLVSESVYFAQPSWLNTAEQVFRDIQNSCEPSMFSLERLLFSISTDGRTNVEVLKQVLPMVLQIRQEELDFRKQLYALGLKTSERLPLPEVNIKRRKARQAREEEGDYECEICRANLFVSLVTNSHEEGVYCLPHAIELLTKKRHHLKYCKLMYTYDQAELNELIQKLQERIEAKSQRKSQGKHSTTSQKP